MSQQPPEGEPPIFELSVTLSRAGMARKSALIQAVTIARNLSGIGLDGEVTVINETTREVLFFSVISKDTVRRDG